MSTQGRARSSASSAPTMVDVATKAGVSLKTVSRVINGEPGASAETRSRVERAVTELRYRRNTAASELRSGRSDTVGLVLDDVSEPFQSALAHTIELELRKAGLLLITISTGSAQEQEFRALKTLAERRCDGIMFIPQTRDYASVQEMLGASVPAVVIDRPAAGLDADTVRSNHLEGAFDAAGQLFRKGHKKVAYFGDPTTLYTGAQRLQGYVDACVEWGIPFDPRLTHLQDPNEPGVGDSFKRMMVSGDPPTAVLTGNSLTTVALLRSGEFNPRETALIAFDELALGDLLKTPLTVIAQDTTEIGRAAARLLLDRLSGDKSPSKAVIVPTQLVERESDWALAQPSDAT